MDLCKVYNLPVLLDLFEKALAISKLARDLLYSKYLLCFAEAGFWGCAPRSRFLFCLPCRGLRGCFGRFLSSFSLPTFHCPGGCAP